MPPLRDHRSDIPTLVEYFLNRFVSVNRSTITSVSPEAMRALEAYTWPGNVRELENLIERLVVSVPRSVIELQDLPPEPSARGHTEVHVRSERRRGIADELFSVMKRREGTFWTIVHSKYMARDLSRTNVREIVQRGLEEARGNYKIVARLFNLEPQDYKRFLNFLRQHDCQLSFKDYRR